MGKRPRALRTGLCNADVPRAAPGSRGTHNPVRNAPATVHGCCKKMPLPLTEPEFTIAAGPQHTLFCPKPTKGALGIQTYALRPSPSFFLQVFIATLIAPVAGEQSSHSDPKCYQATSSSVRSMSFYKHKLSSLIPRGFHPRSLRMLFPISAALRTGVDTADPLIPALLPLFSSPKSGIKDPRSGTLSGPWGTERVTATRNPAECGTKPSSETLHFGKHTPIIL